MTPEQAAWIERRYGLKTGSRVTWTPAAINKERYPQIRERMGRDGVGVVERFKWWESGTITVAVYFPARNRPTRDRAFCMETAYPDDLSIVHEGHEQKALT